MVKLSESFIKRRNCQQLNKFSVKDEGQNYLKKITHLFMNEQSIDEINDISTCKNLKVIYLQANVIQKIKNLDFAINLTHLYLQNNEITKIENLDHLTNLKKLYLGSNRISVVEGLVNLINLTELHIEKQKLDVGEQIYFDPRTIDTLSDCLTYLNISDNQLNSLNDIQYLKKLTILEARNNLINDAEDLTVTISSLSNLEKLILQGNPVTKFYNYRENLIAHSSSLNNLDNKEISARSKYFLQKFKDQKINHFRKKELNLSEDITNSLNLPPAFKRAVSRAISHQINPQFSFEGIAIGEDSKLQIFTPWKSAISVRSLKNNHVLPRPFWKNKTKKQKDIEK